MKKLIDKLYTAHVLPKDELAELIGVRAEEEYLFELAREVRHRVFGRCVYVRGLIEFTNYCKCDCFYCGIRRSNAGAERYRLTKEQILSCCETGYAAGMRTFVLQGGEDAYFTDERLCDIVAAIKCAYPDCALTLSVGERSEESYARLKSAGAERYLLRHETANSVHYSRLHPSNQQWEVRRECLMNLKKLGYQVGAGFMVGSPHQTAEHLAQDLVFLHDLQPQMVGIGPFIPHHATPFADKPQGGLELTLYMLALVRLILPNALLPSTTALATIAPDGRERGILAGANVVMPNLSPADVRESYSLYDNKLSFGAEAVEAMDELRERMSAVGYEVVVDRGDAPEFAKRGHESA